MQKRLLISIDEQIYNGLMRLVGRGKISKFLEDLARPLVTGESLDKAYKKMAKDREREREALKWSNGLIGDAGDEAR